MSQYSAWANHAGRLQPAVSNNKASSLFILQYLLNCLTELLMREVCEPAPSWFLNTNLSLLHSALAEHINHRVGLHCQGVQTEALDSGPIYWCLWWIQRDLRVLLPSSSQFSDSMFSELAPRSKRFVLVPLQPHLGKIQLFADTLKGLSENEMIYGSQIYLLANNAKQWDFLS